MDCFHVYNYVYTLFLSLTPSMTIPMHSVIFSGHRGPLSKTHGSYLESYSLIRAYGPYGPAVRTCKSRSRSSDVYINSPSDRKLDFVRFAHSRGVILRDIKPHNFAVGRLVEDASRIFAFDFGLAKMYVDAASGTHIPLRTGRRLCGTWRYCSHWTHLGLGAFQVVFMTISNGLIAVYRGQPPRRYCSPRTRTPRASAWPVALERHCRSHCQSQDRENGQNEEPFRPISLHPPRPVSARTARVARSRACAGV